MRRKTASESRLSKASRGKRPIRFKSRFLLENLESRQFLTALAISGDFGTPTHYTLSLATDDSAVAANGTIAIDWGDGTGDVVYGTANTVGHDYADTDPHTIVAYAANSLSIANGDTVTLSDEDHRTMMLDTLTMASNSTLDITDHDLLLGHASLAGVQAAILAEYGLGSPGDPIIKSSTAEANNAFIPPVNVDGVNWLNTSFSGSDLVYVKYAYFGDVTLDGTVDNLDFATMAGNFGKTTPGLTDVTTSWLMGDANLDGVVDNLDFAIAAGNFGDGTSDAGRFLVAEAFGNPGDINPGAALATSNALDINEAAVTSISDPADAGSGHLAYTVTFNKSVSGVDASDFQLQATGSVTGESVLGVSGSGTGYTVTVDPGSGWGTLELDLVDDDTIHDAGGHKLGGDGVGNGDFFGPELEPSLTVTGTPTATEGSGVSFSLGTDHYTLPADSTWEIDWGDGSTDTPSGSTASASHNYMSGVGVYYPAIVATDPNGQTFTADVGTISVTPSAPTGVAVADNGDGSATLTWDTPSALSAWYSLEMSVDGGDFTLYADDILPAAQSFQVLGITANHCYEFKLGSANAATTTAAPVWAVMGATVDAQAPIISLDSETVANVQDTVKLRISAPSAGVAWYAVQLQERVHDDTGIHFSGNWHTVYLNSALPSDAEGNYVSLTLQSCSNYQVRLVETTNDAQQVASDSIEFTTQTPASTLDAYPIVNALGGISVVAQGDPNDIHAYMRSSDNYYPDEWLWDFGFNEDLMADQVLVINGDTGASALVDTSSLTLPSAFQTISGSRDPATGQVTLTGWTPPGTGYQLYAFNADANASTAYHGGILASVSGDASSIVSTPGTFNDMLSPDQHVGVFAVAQQQLSTVPLTPEPFSRVSNRVVLGDTPYAPADPMAALDDSGAAQQVNLAWQDVNAAESYYQVQRWDEASQTWQYLPLGAGVSDHVDGTTFTDSTSLAQNPTLAYHTVPTDAGGSTTDIVWGYGLRYRVRTVRVVGASTFYSDWAMGAVADPLGGGNGLITVDIDADNNNGLGAPDGNAVERGLKDNPALPGKILRDGYHDQDGDLIPDFADGFNRDGIAANDDNHSAGQFAEMVITVDPAVNLAQALIRIDYANPAIPWAIARGGTGADDDPYFYTTDGTIRIRLHDAFANRQETVAVAGGDFVGPGIYTPAQLGITDVNRSVTLYVEGVNPGSARIVVRLSPTGDVRLFTAMDAARATVIDPAPDSITGWQFKSLAAAHLSLSSWLPAIGFQGQMGAVKRVYAYYENLYTTAAAGGSDYMLWAGMAKLAGGGVFGALEDLQRGEDDFLDAANATLNPIALAADELLADTTHKTIQLLLEGQQQIFLDLAWQQEAYRQKGLDALDEVFFRDHVRGKFRIRAYNAWRTIDFDNRSGITNDLYSANMDLLFIEQKFIIQPYYDLITALNPVSKLAIILGCPQFVLDALPSLAGEMMGAMIQNPILGGDSMLLYRFLAYGTVGANLGDFDQRWDWLTNEMGPDYDALGMAGRFGMITTPLTNPVGIPGLAEQARLGDLGIDLIVASISEILSPLW